MNTLKHCLFLAFAFSTCLLVSCDKNSFETQVVYYTNSEGKDLYPSINAKLNLPEIPLEYVQEFPDYYRTSKAVFDQDMATLGRVLFYDKNLSEDRNISCASCHDQKLAFADAKAFSDGVNGHTTARNSLALGSVFSFREYYGDPNNGRIPFFWDNSANTVQEQSKRTFANEDEMNMKMTDVIKRVKEEAFYEPLFIAATKSNKIEEQTILDAIGEFVNSIGSFNSRFDIALDEFLKTENRVSIDTKNFSSFNVAENLGKKVFMASCSSCHGQINGMPGAIKANNGLDLVYEDTGIKGTAEFKVPTLRNIALTGPYMHDGRFNTLEEVVNHYSSGIKDHPSLGSGLKSGNNPKRFNFSDKEKAGLIAFMHTFTDKDFLNKEIYSDPFLF